jgi:acyl-coenzyme A thioesterase PaaI-like protein
MCRRTGSRHIAPRRASTSIFDPKLLAVLQALLNVVDTVPGKREHPAMRSPGKVLLKLWRRLHRLPGGTWLFSRVLGWRVPYSGSVRPHVRVLEPGHAEIEIPDRRANRQHLGSVHAIALLNVAEQASGLALLTGLPDGIRGIVTQISMQYFKKARGTIRAVSRVATPTVTSDIEFDVAADCLDRSGDVVARAMVRWRLGTQR